MEMAPPDSPPDAAATCLWCRHPPRINNKKAATYLPLSSTILFYKTGNAGHAGTSQQVLDILLHLKTLQGRSELSGSFGLFVYMFGA